MGDKQSPSRIAYRIGQFRRAYSDVPDPQALARAEKFLSPEQFALFSQMLPFEQAHALQVFEGIQNAGADSAPLLTAALLHDVGKVRYALRPWQRAIAVLLQKLAPGIYLQMGERAPLKGWRAGVVVAVQHARWGAEMVAETGAPPLAIDLILHHQDEEISSLSETIQPLLRLLKQIDENN